MLRFVMNPTVKSHVLKLCRAYVMPCYHHSHLTMNVMVGRSGRVSIPMRGVTCSSPVMLSINSLCRTK
ncbi:unnamed protein product [Fusarium graminearum]|uniref:Uncharacterized protein n=1 Tax=Gibberella zeae TaxID=5518 RepID=A0A9N8R8Q9_GIBZA|nr:unnamed protein product [Fusarium graminearum]CAG1977918.1 unnamed protein product [Fusarium graminearum]CZS81018.1 unnamed protein product [Fusarium graminearum]